MPVLPTAMPIMMPTMPSRRKAVGVSARLRDHCLARKGEGRRNTLAGSPTPLKEPLPAPWLNERVGSLPPPAASGRDTAFLRRGPCDGHRPARTPCVAPIADRGRIRENASPDPAPWRLSQREADVAARSGRGLGAPASMPPSPRGAGRIARRTRPRASFASILRDLLPSTHRQMGIRFPIGRADALASHDRMIDEKPLRHKHFCCANRRFLCIKLRDSHSFSFALPQAFPQPAGTIHSAGAMRPLQPCAARGSASLTRSDQRAT